MRRLSANEIQYLRHLHSGIPWKKARIIFFPPGRRMPPFCQTFAGVLRERISLLEELADSAPLDAFIKRRKFETLVQN